MPRFRSLSANAVTALIFCLIAVTAIGAITLFLARFDQVPVAITLGAVLAGAILSAVAVVPATVLWVRRRYAEPLAALTETAERVARGDLDARFDLERPGDFGRLAEALNSLMATVRAIHHNLEGLIATRTAESAEREQRFRDFAESSSDWLWETDDQHRLIAFEGDRGRFRTLNPNKALGRTRVELMAGAAPPELIEQHLADLDARRPFRDFIYPNLQEVGERRYLRVNGKPRFDAEGRFLGYRGTANDITEALEADARLKSLEHQLTTAISIMSEGFALYDADDILIVCNDRYREIFPLTADFVKPGVRFRDVVATAYRRGQYGVSETDIAAWVAQRLEIHASPDPQPFLQYLSNGTVLRTVERRTPDGGVVGLYSDVTEDIRLKKQLTDAKDAAEAGSRAKSEFLATMSHEIRTPMNGIIGMTELLLDSDLDRRQLHYAEIVRDSAEALLAVINDILDYSSMEMGRLAIADQVFDPLALVEAAIESLVLTAEEKGLDFVAAFDPALPARVRGDADRVRQIVVNLLDNAIKFTDAGSVSIEIKVLGVDVANLSRIRIEVSDTGIGIAEDALGRLFTSFSQVDASLSRRFSGTGLGLAICRRLVEMMGGTIGVESALGAGSRFWFELPLVVAAPRAALPSSLSGRRLLLVDNIPAGRDLRGRMLEGYGIEVETITWADAFSRLGSSGVPRRDAAAGLAFDAAMVVVPKRSNPSGLWRLAGMASYCPVLVLMPRADLDSVWAGGCPIGITLLAQPIRRDHLIAALTRLVDSGADDAVPPPPSPAPPAVPDAAAPTAEPPSPPLRILVAEDNPANQQLVGEILTRLGHRLDLVDNGADAIAAAHAYRYDLVIMDVRMPVMDGLTASATIRNDGGASRDVPIIAVTAHALAGDREACLAAGMDDYLAKPIDSTRLTALVRRWGGRDRKHPASL